MDGSALRREAEAAKSLLANVRDVIGDDDDAARDLVEGETGLVDAIAAADLRLTHLSSLVGGIDAAIARLGERKSRLEAQAERIRTAIAGAMGDVGQKTLELPTGTLTLRAGTPSLRVISEVDIPSAFLVEKTEVRPDRKAITAALKDGVTVPGCELSNGAPTLSIRRG